MDRPLPIVPSRRADSPFAGIFNGRRPNPELCSTTCFSLYPARVLHPRENQARLCIFNKLFPYLPGVMILTTIPAEAPSRLNCRIVDRGMKTDAILLLQTRS